MYHINLPSHTMQIDNFEFKAKVDTYKSYEEKLLELNPEYKGVDHQVDTYFVQLKGRLKLREGNIENSLIFYNRPNSPTAKLSKVILYKFDPNPALHAILSTLFETLVVVKKTRKIYFIDNVKFHFDQVSGLGEFIEVESIGKEGSHTIEELSKSTHFYQNYFGISEEQLIEMSYSDLLLEKA